MTDDGDETRNRGIRVMVFSLNPSRQWDDRGTGYIRDFMPNGEMSFTVRCEDTNECLLNHRVSNDVEYIKQGDSIITWFDIEADNDLAVSFQESGACDSVWKQIQLSIATDAAEDRVMMPLTGDDSDHDSINDNNVSFHDDFVDLPMPSFESLEKIQDLLMRGISSQRIVLAAAISEPAWFSALLDTFAQANDLDHLESLYMIFSIVKSMFLLNSISVIDMLTSYDKFDTVIHMLEFDPQLTLSEPEGAEIDYTQHRKAVASVRFGDIVPIGNESIIKMIRQHYRVTYLRDVIMLRHMDDPLTSTLNSMLLFNVVNIITPLSQDTAFLDRLFAKLRDACADARNPTPESLDLFKFVQELVNLSKNLPLHTDFFSTLCSRGLIANLARFLSQIQPDCSSSTAMPPISPRTSSILLLVFDVLHTLSVHDPQYVRAFMLAESSRSTLLKALIAIMTSSDESIDNGLQAQASNLINVLLIADSLEFCQQRTFMEAAFEPHIGTLINCICDASSRSSAVLQTAALLTQCIREHGAALAPRLRQLHYERAAIALLDTNRESSILLAGVRMVRAACTQLFPTESKSLEEGDVLLRACIELFLFNGRDRYNLLNSALIELLEFIRTTNIKSLVAYLDDVELERIGPITYVSVFDGLRIRAAQNREVNGISAALDVVVNNSESASHQFSDQLREEQYFQSIVDPDDAVVSDEDGAPLETADGGNGSTPKFIDRSEFLSTEPEPEFITIVKKRPNKRLKRVGSARPSIAIRRLVNYTMDDDDSEDSDHHKRRIPLGSSESGTSSAADSPTSSTNATGSIDENDPDLGTFTRNAAVRQET